MERETERKRRKTKFRGWQGGYRPTERERETEEGGT